MAEHQQLTDSHEITYTTAGFEHGSRIYKLTMNRGRHILTPKSLINRSTIFQDEYLSVSLNLGTNLHLSRNLNTSLSTRAGSFFNSVTGAINLKVFYAKKLKSKSGGLLVGGHLELGRILKIGVFLPYTCRLVFNFLHNPSIGIGYNVEANRPEMYTEQTAQMGSLAVTSGYRIHNDRFFEPYNYVTLGLGYISPSQGYDSHFLEYDPGSVRLALDIGLESDIMDQEMLINDTTDKLRLHNQKSYLGMSAHYKRKGNVILNFDIGTYLNCINGDFMINKITPYKDTAAHSGESIHLFQVNLLSPLLTLFNILLELARHKYKELDCNFFGGIRLGIGAAFYVSQYSYGGIRFGYSWATTTGELTQLNAQHILMDGSEVHERRHNVYLGMVFTTTLSNNMAFSFRPFIKLNWTKPSEIERSDHTRILVRRKTNISAGYGLVVMHY